MLDLQTPEPPLVPPEPEPDWDAYDRGKDAWDERRWECERDEAGEAA